MKTETAKTVEMNTLCVCGHEYGNHRASSPSACLGDTPGQDSCWRSCPEFKTAKPPRAGKGRGR